MQAWRVAFLLLLLPAAALIACGDDDGEDDGSPSEVTREVLASALSEHAPGYEVALSRVVIPAGVELATHIHPGPQLAWVAEGTLTYTVESGEVTVTRDAGTAGQSTETIGAGETTELETGDAVVEEPGVIHGSRNDGDGLVVIYLSTLFEAGAPASSPAGD